MRSEPISVLLDRAALEIARARASAFRETGCTPLDHDILAALSRRPYFSLAALARSLSVDRTTLLKRIRVNFGQGWISTCGSTRRRTRARLTPAGREMLAALADLARVAEEDCTTRLLEHPLFRRLRRAYRKRTRTTPTAATDERLDC